MPSLKIALGLTWVALRSSEPRGKRLCFTNLVFLVPVVFLRFSNNVIKICYTILLKEDMSN